MKASSVYSTIGKSATIAALLVTALVGATTAQARPHYIQDVQYVQVSPQLVITPPQLVVQAPAPVFVHPRYARPTHVRPVAVQHPVVYGPQYVTGRIYYIDGRPFLNGHPYYGHKRHKVKHFDKHGDKHFGKHHGYGHGYGHKDGYR